MCVNLNEYELLAWPSVVGRYKYTKHTGKFKKLEEGIVINFKTSKEIYTLFGEIAQVGSRKYHIYYF